MTDEAIKQAAEIIFNQREFTEEQKMLQMIAFFSGAKWRIKHVWHDITEIPENNRSLLCVTDHGCNVFGPNNTEFKELVEYFHIKKWAYLEDLIPNTED